MIALRRGVSQARPFARPARGGDHERLRTSDVRLLGWLAEQYGAPASQLEPLLDRGERTVQRTVARLGAAGLVQVVRILVGEGAWVIPTTAGIRTAGYGFPGWRPRVGLLAHVAAVNEVRLHIQSTSPDTEWVSERLLLGERTGGEHLPDGLAIADAQRIAIEVELTVKSRRRTEAILDALSGKFDAVVYFCAPGPHRLLSELEASGRWRRLSVRQLPGASTPRP
jgi:hypothetical protein